MPIPGANFIFEWGQYTLKEVQEFSITDDAGAPPSTSGMLFRGNSSWYTDGRIVTLTSFQPVFPTEAPSHVLKPGRGARGSLHISFRGTINVGDEFGGGETDGRHWIVRHIATYQGFNCVAVTNDAVRFNHSFKLLRSYRDTYNVRGGS